MTPSSQSQTKGVPLISGSDLYDTIMGAIEPDLTSANLETTKQRVLDATLDERKEMATRYSDAFVEYDKRVGEHEKEWAKSFHTYKRQSLVSSEAFLGSEEKDMLTSLEQQFSDSSR